LALLLRQDLILAPPILRSSYSGVGEREGERERRRESLGERKIMRK
jgi:hypothetical protein